MNELFSEYFYRHLDGSIVCKKCERTLDEGCSCYKLRLRK